MVILSGVMKVQSVWVAVRRFTMILGVFAAALVLTLLPGWPGWAGGAVEEPQTLSLDPQSGLPGSVVTWVATGFGDCTPQFDDVGDGEIGLQWDGNELSRADVSGDGTTKATFVVPGAAAIGSQRVVAVCLDRVDLVAEITFEVVEESLTLSLEPPSGPPGSSVGWVATVVGHCPPTFDDVGSGVIVLAWDGTELGRTGVDANNMATSTFLVPEAAAIGPHTVVAVCPGKDELVVEIEFEVTAPEVPPVQVPSVLGLTEEEARSALEALMLPAVVIGDGEVVQTQEPAGGTSVKPGTRVTIDLGNIVPVTVAVPNLIEMSLGDALQAVVEAQLELGGVSGDQAGVVTDQSPAPGEAVLVGTPVSIALAVPQPQTVQVPDLVGENLDEVPGILVSQGLTLGLVSGGTAGEVVSQTPAAGTEVEPGSDVNVSVEAGEEPVDLVAVPDLSGGSTTDARSALEAAGLVLGGADPGEGEVTGQNPLAGTLVPLGSTVSLVMQAQPPQSPWAGLGGLVAVLGAAGAFAYNPVRRVVDRRWIRKHLTIRPGRRPQEARVAEAPREESPPTRVVRIAPRPDPGTHLVQEGEP